MAKGNFLINRFNRGMVSPLALARIDLENISFYGEDFTNWMPRVLGSMQMRPGLEYISPTNDSDKAKHIPFVFSNDDTAIIELTDSLMRVRVDETVISRLSVSSAISNPSFTTDLSSWTDDSATGCTASWYAGGYAALVGNSFNRAKLRQNVSLAVADIGVEHAIRVVVTRGKCYFRVGSTSTNDDFFTETLLGVGTHSLSFTPTADFNVTIAADQKYRTLVDSVTIESVGEMEIPAPWLETDQGNVRYTQSADILYVAVDGYQQYKIERRSTTSWSVVKYMPEDGPFRNINTSRKTITASATSGDITLNSNDSVFKAENVGGLYRLESVGQFVSISVTGENQWSDPVQVTGVGTSRDITVVRAGTWSATVTLQRSVGDIGNWTDVTTYTTNASVTYNDTLDNQIIFYRIGVDTADFTSGTADLSLQCAAGSITGIVRITGYTSETSVDAIVLKALGSTAATDSWYEGSWSDRRGFPSAVAFYDGRLVWAGKDKIFCSVSDAFESFDDEVVGDSGPIQRSIGSGPVDKINWLLPMYRLVLGGQGDEWEIRSSALDEPITPSNFNIKSASNQGSAGVQASKVDGTGVFVQRSGKRVYELGYSQDQFNNYQTDDLTKLFPEAAGEGNTFIQIAVQRQPDTRIHCLRSDGKVAINVRDHAETVKAWMIFETEGEVEDIFVMPGDEEDSVYYCVKRMLGDETVRYLERWSMESECQGGTINKLADSHVLYDGTAISVVTGADHLEGKTVTVWGVASGVTKYLGDFTVVGGSFTLAEAASPFVYGLNYTARFKSSKLAYAASMGTALNQRKIMNELGLVGRNICAGGLQYGQDLNNLDYLPVIETGDTFSDDFIYPEYDNLMFEFNGDYDTDPRLFLQCESPFAATLLAVTMAIRTNDRG